MENALEQIRQSYAIYARLKLESQQAEEEHAAYTSRDNEPERPATISSQDELDIYLQAVEDFRSRSKELREIAEEKEEQCTFRLDQLKRSIVMENSSLLVGTWIKIDDEIAIRLIHHKVNRSYGYQLEAKPWSEVCDE